MNSSQSKWKKFIHSNTEDPEADHQHNSSTNMGMHAS